MQTEKIIKIPYSITKISSWFIAGLVIVALGVWGLNAPVKPTMKAFYLLRNPIVKTTCCIIFIIYGLIGSILSIKLFKNGPMLILDNNGLTNNLVNAAKYIPWSEMKDAEIVSIRESKFILIKLKNPDIYIIEPTNFFKKKIRQMEYKKFGTSVIIATNGLKISTEELFKLINDKLTKHNKKSF